MKHVNTLFQTSTQKYVLALFQHLHFINSNLRMYMYLCMYLHMYVHVHVKTVCVELLAHDFVVYLIFPYLEYAINLHICTIFWKNEFLTNPLEQARSIELKIK
jgi:hypothetical protein